MPDIWLTLRLQNLTLPRRKKILIGKFDEIDFPDLNLFRVKAKVDTGADTSSIHVRKIKIEEKAGVEVLSCYFQAGSRTVFKEFRQKWVRSSNGERQFRYVVKLPVVIFGMLHETEFTLNDRKSMNYPVLLGKRFLRGNFIVDVNLSNLSAKNKLIIL